MLPLFSMFHFGVISTSLSKYNTVEIPLLPLLSVEVRMRATCTVQCASKVDALIAPTVDIYA